jgi:hypothetical protein
MKNIRRVVVLVGAIASGAASAGLIATGCGGDDSLGPSSSGDAGADATTTPDSSTPGTDSEANPETGGGGDAAPDVKEVGDAGEAGVVPPGDAGPDAGDSGGGIVLGLTTFPELTAEALCNRFQNCCAAPAAGQVFDTSGCISRFLNFGYAGSSTGQSLLDGGHVVFNQAQAESCLSQIAAIDCSANLRTSAQEQAIITACFGALSGTLEAGAPCAGPIECAPGQFCAPQDAGGSACAPLRTSGQSCADFGSNNFAGSDTACSYRASGNTGLTCKNGDFNTYGDIPLSQWVCTPEQAVDGGCFVNVDCSSKLCDPGANATIYKCAQSETFIYPFSCSSFSIVAPVDAGTDAGHD